MNESHWNPFQPLLLTVVYGVSVAPLGLLTVVTAVVLRVALAWQVPWHEPGSDRGVVHQRRAQQPH
jgi:membrane glycosyltransferase